MTKTKSLTINLAKHLKKVQNAHVSSILAVELLGGYMFRRSKFQGLATVAALFSVLLPANTEAAVAFEPQSLFPQVRNVVPANSSAPTVSGSASEGSVLSLSNGTWTSSPTSFAYTWYRCTAAQTRAAAVVSSRCTLITGASTSSLTLGTLDVGRFIVGGVRAQNASGASFFSSVSTAAVTRLAAPTVISPPVISGTSRLSETISISTGSWTSAPTSYSYAWFRCTSAVTRIPTSLPRGCTAISGATQSTYRVQDPDLSRFILGSVAATNRAGSRTAFTVTTAAIAQASRSAPRIQSAPKIDFSPTGVDSITGRALVGSVLVVNKGLWLGSPTPAVSHTYWYRCATKVSVELSAAPDTCFAIPGSNGINGETYLVTAEDVNFFLAFEVIAINDVATVRYFTTSTDSVSSTPISLADPVLTGDPKFRGVLSVSNGLWASPPSIPLSFDYSWFRCESQNPTITIGRPGGCEVIAGAESRQYTVSKQDLGFYIHGTVRAFNSFGFIAFDTAQSLGQSTSVPVNLAVPALSGETTVGSELSVSLGDWAAFPSPTTTYQWFRCTSQVSAVVLTLPSQCSVIADATSATYTQVAADAGRFVTVRTTQTNSQGTTNLWSSSTSVTNQPPTLVAAPTISGKTNFGETLTVNPGSWQGLPIPIISYQWYNCESPVTESSSSLAGGCYLISGQTSSSTVLSLNSLLGMHLMARVTATNTLVTNSHFTASAGPITRTPTATVDPAVSGTRTTGSVLTVSAGTWQAFPAPTTTYQWFRCTSQVSAVVLTLPSQCSVIADATSATYTQVAADAGRFVTVRTTQTNSQGTTNLWSSSTSVTNQPPTLVAAPTISGTASWANYLTAETGSWTGTPSPGFSYKWYYCTAEVPSDSSTLDPMCSAIPTSVSNSAYWTKSEFLTATEYLGKHLMVRVTAGNGGGALSHFSKTVGPITRIPTFLTWPSILGDRAVGSVLTVQPSTLSSFPAPSVSYQWYRCDQYGQSCSPIDGASSSSYTQVAADAGWYVGAAKTLTNDLGSAVANLRGSTQTTQAPTLISEPSISGTLAFGSRLTAEPGTWQGFPQPNFTYAWYSCLSEISSSYSSVPENCQELGLGEKSVSAGGSGTCVLLKTGKVECWGNNAVGQLGNEQFTALRSLSRVTVDRITNATAVSSGQSHTCAITDLGNVQCWGYNGYGQLGTGSTTSRRFPAPVSGISSAIAISAGWGHSCAVLSDRTVRCWGSNSRGELGNNSTTRSLTPVQVSGITNAVSVSAGTSQTCALLSSGAIRCWGKNNNGELGAGGSTLLERTPVLVSGISNAIEISVGTGHSCALLANGSVKCWGQNGNGQLGTNSTSTSFIPLTVSNITTATQVSVSQSYSCALLSNGSVWCWGMNTEGQLGNNSTTRSLIPVQVSGLTDATEISVGASHSCALLATGKVFCWGFNDNGQLGNISQTNSPVPVATRYVKSFVVLSDPNVPTYVIVQVTATNSIATNTRVSQSVGTSAR